MNGNSSQRVRWVRSLILPATCALVCAYALTSPVIVEAVPQQLAARRVLRIDATREDFLPFDRVRVSSRGLMAIPQLDDRRIIVFDSLGRRVSIVGRRGAGPGEIEQMRGFGWIGDSIWVYDRGSRLSLFRADGTFLRQRDLADPVFPGRERRPSLALRSVEAILPNARDLLVRTSPVSTDPVDCPCLVSITNAGEVVRVVLESSSREAYPTAVGTSSYSLSVPFGWNHYQSVSPDGGAIAVVLAKKADRDAGRFRVILVRSSGDTVFNTTQQVELSRIPASDISSAIASRTQMIRDANSSSGELRSLIPTSYQPYEGVIVGRDETVWIKLRARNGQNPWLILDRRGAVIGRLTLPISVSPSEVGRSRFVGYEEDSDGFRHIVVYQMTPAGM